MVTESTEMGAIGYNNGDGVNAIVLRNLCTVGTMSEGSGDHIAYGVPHRRDSDVCKNLC